MGMAASPQPQPIGKAAAPEETGATKAVARTSDVDRVRMGTIRAPKKLKDQAGMLTAKRGERAGLCRSTRRAGDAACANLRHARLQDAAPRRCLLAVTSLRGSSGCTMHRPMGLHIGTGLSLISDKP